jgi:hypothetical protein
VNVDSLQALASAWRDDAKTLRAYGDERGATTAESHAAQLERTLQEWEEEPLPIATAAAESGYSAYRLRELARQEKIRAHREGGEWRIVRRDLPIRPTQPEPDRIVVDLAARINAAR